MVANNRKHSVLRIMAFGVIAATMAHSADAATQRILLVGDSWPMMMWIGCLPGRAFQNALTDRGYGQWEESGAFTAYTTTTARDYGENAPTASGLGRLDLVLRELNENPTIDIAHLSLGGNDFMDGDYSDILGDPTFSSGWKKSWSGAQEDLFFDAVCDQICVVIEAMLDLRPDIRLAVCSYEFSGLTTGGGSRLETNEAGLRLEAKKLALCQAISADPLYLDRCFYINASGLMQYVYGYPYPLEPEEDPIYGPMGTPGTGGTIQKPGGYPTYDPFPGGDITYPCPEGTVRDIIHLNRTGFITLAGHCIDEFYGAWLDLPKVMSVVRTTPSPLNPNDLYNPTSADQVTFEVTFSEPVSGVDEVDFDVVMDGVIGASIESVSEAKDATTYEVTVTTGTGDGTLALAILDNDSILDADLNPLGGVGTNNGYFAYGTPYDMDRSVGLALAACPMALALLLAGLGLLRRHPRQQ